MSSSDLLTPGFMSHASDELCRNADVLSTIFSFLTVNHLMDADETSIARKTLLAAAKSCKAFQEPALNALWRVIPSLLPLLRLIPSLTKLDGVYVLDDVQDKDWNLYNRYCKRVREVVFQKFGQPEVSPFVYSQMTRMRQLNNGSLLLPHLKAIRLASGIKVDPALLLSLPGPQTECIVFGDDDADYTTHFLRAFLATLSQSPNLTRLSLSGSHILPLGTISKLSRLRSLTILLPHLPQSFYVLKSLTALEHLTELTLHTGPPSSDDPAIPVAAIKGGTPSREHQLSSLRRFKLVGHPASVAKMLNDILPMNVEEFIVDEEEIHSEALPTTISWETIFSRLSLLPHLQSIEVNQLSKRRWGLPGIALAMDLITPSLINLPNPSKFHSLVINNGAMNASYFSVKSFCLVFKHLRVFKLPLVGYHKFIRLPTILKSIISQCPVLETLQISGSQKVFLDNNAMVRRQLSPISRRRPHPLKHFFLCDSIGQQITQSGMDNTLLYAEFFDFVFPDLEALVLPDKTNQSWEAVEKATLALQRSRRRHTAREEHQAMLDES